MEVFNLVAQKKTPLKIFLTWLCLLAALVAYLLSCSQYTWIIFIALGLSMVWFFLQFRSDIEYEYSYFDGDVRFARVRHKSSRKALKVYHIEELVAIAPAGDRSMYHYENDKSVKVMDYTSMKKGVPYYDMIIKTANQTFLYKVELEDDYLDAVSVKYAYKVTRRKE